MLANDPAERKRYIRAMADSIVANNNYFRDSKIEEYRVRNAECIRLQAYDAPFYRRIIIMSNQYSNLFLFYRERNTEEKAKESADFIQKSIILREFGD